MLHSDETAGDVNGCIAKRSVLPENNHGHGFGNICIRPLCDCSSVLLLCRDVTLAPTCGSGFLFTRYTNPNGHAHHRPGTVVTLNTATTLSAPCSADPICDPQGPPPYTGFGMVSVQAPLGALCLCGSIRHSDSEMSY